MSYCRFRNTFADLRDCYQAMAETGGGSPEWDEIGDEEKRARTKLIMLCKQIGDEFTP